MGDRRANVAASIGEGPHFHVIIEDIMVAMRDQVKLAGDLYIPAVDGKVDPHRRWPCVLVRTPYNKSSVNPDFRNPGIYWTQNAFCCFIQDVRGRFKSDGIFYKYTGEAEDGYDTVEWLAKQPWCNGSIVCDGPSYLAHVQTSMALLRPPHLKALFVNKGGFFNAFTSGVRQGGCYEARQWVWGIKNASRKTPLLRAAIIDTESKADEWFRRYPWKRGASPLSSSPEYEDYLYDQVDQDEYSDYWKQRGLNTEEYINDFADVPVLLSSGWFDIYAKSTVEFFTHLFPRLKSPVRLIMGPWQHVGPEGHVAGEVDFGVNALITGNLATNVFSLSRRWFDRFVEPATPSKQQYNNNSGLSASENKLQQAIAQASHQQDNIAQYGGSPQQSMNRPEPQIASTHHHTLSYSQQHQQQQPGNPPAHPQSYSSPTQHAQQQYPQSMPRGPYTSLSRGGWQLPAAEPNSGPSLYVLPSAAPRDHITPVQDPLPPPVRYFRMGGGDGHKTTQGNLFHGGVWMQSYHWPPVGTEHRCMFLRKRSLSTSPDYTDSNTHPNRTGSGADITNQLQRMTVSGEVNTSQLPNGTTPAHDPSTQKISTNQQQPAQQPTAQSNKNVDLSEDIDAWAEAPPPTSLLHNAQHSTTFVYDPSHPCPAIGGHVFNFKNILLGGTYNQVERADMFLCKPPYLPLSSRRDVVVFRSEPLTERTDVTGHPYVYLYVSSDCVDTDFHVKLIDEYPPSNDYPNGFAMLVTHGIQRVKLRKQGGRGKAQLIQPGNVYAIRVDMYPTSNLFNKNHRIRVDVSSSCFPHFDINPNTGLGSDSIDYKVARNTVWHTQRYPSRLVLPIQTQSASAHSVHMEEVGHG